MSSSTSGDGTTAGDDPHKFLEDVLGDDALKWVKERNNDCLGALGDPTKTEEYKRILAILDSKDKIPSIAQIGSRDKGMYYNFWQDEKHVQGIWRKTTLESFRTSEPEWSTVLDLDALLPPDTGTASTWVWHGSTLLDEGTDSAWDRALISLSPGGSDAHITREMNLVTEQFMDPETEGGFAMPTAAKTRMSYRSRDEVIIGTDFNGDGSTMTDSGYPKILKSWKRGTDITEAVTIFEVEQSDISASQWAYHDRDGICHEFRLRTKTFYSSTYEYRSLTPEQLRTDTADSESNPPFRPVPIQEDADIYTFGAEAIISLRSDWQPPGTTTTYQAGASLTLPMSQVMNNNWSNVQVLFQPTPTKSLQGTTTTRDYVVLSILEDVRTKLVIWKYEGTTASTKFSLLSQNDDETVPIGENLRVSNVNRDCAMDNSVFLWRDGFLKPQTMEFLDDVALLVNGKQQSSEKLKANPSMFHADDLCVEQYFCKSADGTKVPYFLIRRKDMKFDGNNPTLVDAYGGFEISMLPYYSASVGAAWLESGAVKVVANIRGGDEYGPTWHQAALKENRYKCFEDMEAIAEDLITRLNVTNPSKLACIGGSNGGLLVGNLITRPISSKLYRSAVCQVPLLDMKVYSKLLAGASWMAEYGDPDKPEEWAFLRNHSPYHILRHDLLAILEAGQEKKGEESQQPRNPEWTCPTVLFTTSTRDDRVHPAHARKMVRALLEEAKPMGKADKVFYWENIEGGHGGAADNKQRAHMWALTYSFLKQTFGVSKNNE